MEPRISILTLGVKDLQKSIDFYVNGLGWTKSAASQDDIVFLKLNNIVLTLYPKDLLAEDATVSHEGHGFPGFTIAYNTRNEKEADDVLAKVAKTGATIVKPAQKVFWGGYSGYFSDPDGYLWEVAYNPFLEMDEEGKILLP